ncbi:MAG: glycyl-tRNA synthetase beta chain [Myxococcota bacterium]|jgi:glycyl-tRNA synthetase beta chain
MSEHHQLFVEVLCEELPAGMIEPALSGLRTGLLGVLKGVEHGVIRTWATPRRLAVAIDDVVGATPRVETVHTGPPAARAFKDGQPTKMAEGFARGKGVPVSELMIVDGPRGEVIAATVIEGGVQTAGVIAGALDTIVRGLPFKKSMEWGEGGVRFGRPLLSVNALFGGTVLDATAAGCVCGNSTVGHRLADDPSFTFTDAESWEAGLRERSVIASAPERRLRIQAGLDELTDGIGADRIRDDELMDEVQYLVECPVVIEGAFDEDLMDLPSKLLITSMKVNQRYFPIFEEGVLTNRFAIVSNNPWGDGPLIAQGNARVLRARFYDARFFLAEDQKHTLEHFSAGLNKMRWINGLGTMADKQHRVGALAAALVTHIACENVEVQAGYAGRAGMLCKVDLTTLMVSEFAKLQGHMGRLYAKHHGEPDGVAIAMEEHYLPAFSGGPLPTTTAGTAVALADRLDTLVGCFGIGLIPKGGDPQGLRRAASGVLALLEGSTIRMQLDQLFRLALSTFQFTLTDSALVREGAEMAYDKWLKKRGQAEEPRDGDALIAQLTEFAMARFKASAVAEGASADRVDAVLAVTPADPVLLRAKVAALEAQAGTANFASIMEMFKRVLNITDGQSADFPERSALSDDAELVLFDAVAAASDQVAAANSALDFDTALTAALALQAPVTTFFDAVMVNDPDPAKKALRVGLLLQTAGVFRSFADFSRVSTR